MTQRRGFCGQSEHDANESRQERQLRKFETLAVDSLAFREFALGLGVESICDLLNVWTCVRGKGDVAFDSDVPEGE